MPVVTDKPDVRSVDRGPELTSEDGRRTTVERSVVICVATGGEADRGARNRLLKHAEVVYDLRRNRCRGGWLVIRHSTVRTALLKAFLPVHTRPINLVVFQGSFVFRQANLISGGASRLDAFSVYPCRT